MLEHERDRPDAVLLQARLAATGATPRENAKQQQEAIARLKAAVKSSPRVVEFYHTLCEIHLKRDERDAAIAVLKEDLKANPSDSTAVARLVELLARTRGGRPARTADLDAARRIAGEVATRDVNGQLTLALAVGLQRARQLELALPYAGSPRPSWTLRPPSSTWETCCCRSPRARPTLNSTHDTHTGCRPV